MQDTWYGQIDVRVSYDKRPAQSMHLSTAYKPDQRLPCAYDSAVLRSI